MRMPFDPSLIALFKNARLAAVATMKGSAEYPQIRGKVSFYVLPGGTMVLTQLSGLPQPEEPMPSDQSEPTDVRCRNPFFGIHVHAGVSCTPTADGPSGEAFSDAGEHLNPYNCLHPGHLGDLPPLLTDQGNALSAFVTSRFTVEQLIGRAVILHRMPDDLHTQPSGNSGKRIACGLIRRV